MRKLIAIILIAAALMAWQRAWAQFVAPMIPCVGGLLCRSYPMVPQNNGSGTGPSPPVGCVSTGVFDLSNVCNDIYFLGGLK